MAARACVRLLLLTALPALTGQWSAARGEVVTVRAPSFPEQATALTAARGQSALLDCQVRALGDNTVSWVRSSDLQILSFAGAVFTADARVAASERRAGTVSHHALAVRDLAPRDSGRYECQVNTEPKLSLFFNLTVVDEEMPSLVVEGDQEVWGAVGGAATLWCGARYEPAPVSLRPPPPEVAWARADGSPLTARGAARPLALDAQRWAARADSRLTLLQLRPDDAGAYSCSAGEPPVTHTVLLRIREQADEPLEAMQRDASSAGGALRAPPPRALLALAAALALAILATS